MDRLTTLPQNVIELILEQLPVVDRVRTSALSTEWRFRWSRHPSLPLDGSFYSYLLHPQGIPSQHEHHHSYYINPRHFKNEGYWHFNVGRRHKSYWQIPASDYLKIATFLVTNHRGIRNFDLLIPQNSSDLSTRNNKPGFDCLFRLLSRIHSPTLESLTVQNYAERQLFVVPDCIFRSSSSVAAAASSALRHLSLFKCKFCLPNGFRGFPNLIYFGTAYCTQTLEDVSSFVSKCPRLQRLVLRGVEFGIDQTVDLEAPELIELSIKGNFKNIFLRNSRKLEKVSVVQYDYLPDIEPGLIFFPFFCTSVNLTEIEIDQYVCKLMGRCGILEKLTIFSEMKILRFYGVCLTDFEQLHYVLRLWACCPNLEKLVIGLDDNDQCTIWSDMIFTLGHIFPFLVNKMKMLSIFKRKEDDDDRRLAEFESLVLKYANFERLKSFGFCGIFCSDLETKMIELMLSMCPVLEELEVEYHDSVTDDELSVIRSRIGREFHVASDRLATVIC